MVYGSIECQSDVFAVEASELLNFQDLCHIDLKSKHIILNKKRNHIV